MLVGGVSLPRNPSPFWCRGRSWSALQRCTPSLFLFFLLLLHRCQKTKSIRWIDMDARRPQSIGEKYLCVNLISPTQITAVVWLGTAHYAIWVIYKPPKSDNDLTFMVTYTSPERAPDRCGVAQTMCWANTWSRECGFVSVVTLKSLHVWRLASTSAASRFKRHENQKISRQVSIKAAWLYEIMWKLLQKPPAQV